MDRYCEMLKIVQPDAHQVFHGGNICNVFDTIMGPSTGTFNHRSCRRRFGFARGSFRTSCGKRQSPKAYSLFPGKSSSNKSNLRLPGNQA